MSANDKQVGGDHYKSESGCQHWDLMADIYGQGYFKAMITKYIARWRKKDGIKDLEKAKHYVEKLKEIYEGGAQIYDDLQPCVTEFCALNKIHTADAAIISAAIAAETLKQLEELEAGIQGLIDTAMDLPW
jgi:hypothetical protein